MAVISGTRQMSGYLHMKEGFSEVRFSMTPTILYPIRGKSIELSIAQHRQTLLACLLQTMSSEPGQDGPLPRVFRDTSMYLYTDIFPNQYIYMFPCHSFVKDLFPAHPWNFYRVLSTHHTNWKPTKPVIFLKIDVLPKFCMAARVTHCTFHNAQCSVPRTMLGWLVLCE